MINSATHRRVAPSAQPKSANIVICAKRDDPFARIPKTILNDPELSWRAKGILSYLLGKPPGWKTRVTDIRKHAKEGERAVRAALKELRRVGYAQLVQLRDGKKIKEWVWKISDSPIFATLDGRNVEVENVDVQNAHHSKNERSKNDFRKNESKETKETANEFAAGSVEEFSAMWIPDSRTQKEKLRSLRPPAKYPSEREFDRFLEREQLDHIPCYRPGLYSDLCNNKWHTWRADLGKYVPIIEWTKYVRGLDTVIANQFER